MDYIQLLIISRAIWVKNVNQNAKKQKRPPKSLKNQMFIFGLLSTSDDQSSNRSKKCRPKCKKWKRPPKSLKNQMFIFGLCSASNDWPSDPSKKRWPKCKKNQKRPPKSSKNQMFIHFWIMFNFWWLAKQSEQKSSTEMQNNKKGPLSHQKIKCSFLDYIQLLMIGRAIWAKNVDQNAKKQKRPPKSLKNQMFNFGLLSTCDDQSSNRSKKRWPKCKKWKRPPKSSKNQMFIHFWIMFNFWWLAKQSEQKTLTKM